MVNRVIGRRTAKKKPMRLESPWPHRLVQIRVAVLGQAAWSKYFNGGTPRFKPQAPPASPVP